MTVTIPMCGQHRWEVWSRPPCFRPPMTPANPIELCLPPMSNFSMSPSNGLGVLAVAAAVEVVPRPKELRLRMATKGRRSILAKPCRVKGRPPISFRRPVRKTRPWALSPRGTRRKSRPEKVRRPNVAEAVAVAAVVPVSPHRPMSHRMRTQRFSRRARRRSRPIPMRMTSRS